MGTVCGMRQVCKTLDDARRNNVIVHAMLDSGNPASLETVILALVNHQAHLENQLLRLHAIAPRKITLPDGRVLVWRCPDEMALSVDVQDFLGTPG